MIDSINIDRALGDVSNGQNSTVPWLIPNCFDRLATEAETYAEMQERGEGVV